MIIAIDGGFYNIGVAILSEDAKIYETDYIKLNNKIKYNPETLSLIYIKLSFIFDKYKNENNLCVYESPNIHNKARSAYGHLKMIGVLELLCKNYDFEVKSSIVASHWKKMLLNNGKSSKEDIMNYIQSNYSYIGEISQHEADAICIGLCYLKDNKLIS